MRRAPRARRPVLALLAAASAGLIVIGVPGGLALRHAAGAEPAGRAGGTSAALGGTAALGGSDAGDVRAYELENARLAARLWAARAEHDRAARLAELREAAPYPGLVPAHVIAVGEGPGRADTVTIDAGTRRGVRPNMAVVSGDGLVGRVIAAGADSATVLLATDVTSGIGARLAGSRHVGIVTGEGMRSGGLLRLRVLDARAPLRVGQRVETLGSRGMRPYPAGVPIGEVIEVEPATDQLTRSALVRPAVRFSALDVVGVVTGSGRSGDARAG
ncbi:rod shape-determining protein MreC [Thermobispora bispora]|uniref:Cell shape-determining protein MreC n=1 Tax=Thermobispora bispora (strain ATCC 19993 / DSM 43833 / CBS 139.67 / JCM 10125 / KCTC 9307 / NBRC 14880 / R51) TaxID=469371 RepID=D6YB39_THEBD|nr:rod shape-determining protein MreC [Thermobispora bispora]ADG88399.1 Rod shape-determining protein MreC [Thermobispora bispora DSM 43833]MBO2475280.1 rod shape-determining protein MreC [Actinomycetales bacterium]QSI48216.1 rod shape-determining protein MreC [Thermobispora bispora]